MGSELHIFSLDTFWKPGSMREKEESPSWWLSAASLKDVKPPGFDSRWNFDVLRAARTAFANDSVRSALLTARPAHKEMKQEIERIIHESSLDFDLIALKPVWPPQETTAYKEMQVRRWLVQERSTARLVLWDRNPSNQAAIASVARQMRIDFSSYPSLRSTEVAGIDASLLSVAG